MSDPFSSQDPRNRQRVLESALARLRGRGFTSDLLAKSASLAGVPIDRAQKFFRRDEELVLALYVRLAQDLEAEVAAIPPGTIGERFRAAMQAKLTLLRPHREAFAALAAVALDPRHELGVAHPQTALVRRIVQGAFAAVVHGATDAPSAGREELIRALYAAHLGVLFLWLQDRTPDGAPVRAALDLAGDALELAAGFAEMGLTSGLIQRFDSILTPFLEEEDSTDVDSTAKEILEVVFAQRRLASDAGGCAAAPCPQCFAFHLTKVKYFLRASRPIHFVLPAFPAKSPSRVKTLGPMPDLAERLALTHLQQMCDRIAAIHPPGARLTICSDGHAFADLVEVPDESVAAYSAEIRRWLASGGITSLDGFDVGDLFDDDSFPDMRRRLLDHYAQSIDEVHARAERLPAAKSLVDGIHRFLVEERLHIHPEASKTKIRNDSRPLAYEVVRRSDAWGRLIADCFPTALRLSIHPQPPHSEKIGILLGPSDDVWLTPWHGVAATWPGGWKLMKRSEAETLGGKLVNVDGRPSHFQLDAEPAPPKARGSKT